MRTLRKSLVLLLLGLAVGLPVAASTFRHSERSVVIGAHNATVVPQFNGYATLDFGAVLPRARIPVNQPFNIGARIYFGDSEVTNLDQLVTQDAVIASQPRGEIQRVVSTVVEMGVEALLRGVGAGVLTVLVAAYGWRAVGPERRAIIWAHARQPTRREIVTGVALGAVTIVSLGLMTVPERPRSANDAVAASWIKLSDALPNVPTDKILDQVEIKRGAASAGGTALIEGAITTYRKSVEFYGKLADQARRTIVRTPADGETTAIVVTDRHDNIGMDAAARAIADQARATMLFDLGDDTSVGGDWEAFSLNSLAKAFKGFTVVSVAGNHDTGPFVRKQMRKKGFNLLDGKPRTINGIRFLGSSDPRSSGLTGGYGGNESDLSDAIHGQDAALMKAACADRSVQVVLVHSPSGAKQTAKSGCVELVLSGHLHRQVGPTTLTNPTGHSTTTLSTGTTGGAVYAFALGSKLRRPAQVTIVTFKSGTPIGLQVIDFGTGGGVTAQPYFELKAEPVVPKLAE